MSVARTYNVAKMDHELRRNALKADSTTVVIGTNGLTLLIAATEVRCASGEILIDSAAELGTTVRVFFPASATTARSRSASDRTPS